MIPAYSSIADLETYTARMGKGIMDKLFFVDKIEPDVIVDFGAADGTLIQNLEPWFPNAHFIGYDIDEAMIKAAKAKHTRHTFLSKWSYVLDAIRIYQTSGRKIALVLSSIVHEVYHYQEPHEVDQFWKDVFESNFDYIVLRDMIPARSMDRPSDMNDVVKVYRKFADKSQLRDFQNVWGSIEGNRNLIHFLLKYKYETPNWNREVKENYLPFYREDLLAMLPFNYDVMYHEHYVLPYIKRTVRDDLGIELKDPTHLKIILERRAT